MPALAYAEQKVTSFLECHFLQSTTDGGALP